MWTAVSHYKTIFADTNPMTKDEIFATSPDRMKLWFSNHLPILRSAGPVERYRCQQGGARGQEEVAFNRGKYR
jgi:hypothetical protein